MPRLSVCIPTYNRADLLADRLRRMAAMQDSLELEISISDNASPDHTRDVVAQFRKSFAGFHYIRQERVVSPPLNFYACLRNATFDHFTLIGDDDTIMPENICTVLSMFDADPSLQTVVGNNELFDFSTGKSHGNTTFVKESERYTATNAHELFSRYYFFEYSVMKRAPVHLYFHNEGFSYPIGWKLLQCALRQGAVRLEPLPIIFKGYSDDQLGYRNYTPELQDAPRADPEIFAGLMMQGAKAGAQKILRQAALMRTVRYSSDSTINANLHKKYLIGMHHAQKAALYDYDTKEYPVVPPDELFFGRLSEWIAEMVNANPSLREVLIEETATGRRLAEWLIPLVSGRQVSTAQFNTLSHNGATQFVVSITFDASIAANAARHSGFPYCAITDLIADCHDRPADKTSVLFDPFTYEGYTA